MVCLPIERHSFLLFFLGSHSPFTTRIIARLRNLMLSSNLLKSKIPICGGGFVEFDVEFKFAKIQNSHLWAVGGGGGGTGLVEPISNF